MDLYEVTSPIDEDVSIMYKGITYELPARGECDRIPEDAMDFWKKTHGFLNFRKMAKAPVIKEKDTDEGDKTVVDGDKTKDTTKEVREVKVKETKPKTPKEVKVKK